MKGITSLCPTSSKYLDQSALEEFAALFGADIEALSHEVCTFKCLLKRKEGAERPGSLLDLRAYLQELKAAFFELERIVSIACTLPVSSAECERNFSSMRLIKNDLRSVMSNERLESLMTLGIHRERGNRINLDNVINRFKARFPKRRIEI